MRSTRRTVTFLAAASIAASGGLAAAHAAPQGSGLDPAVQDGILAAAFLTSQVASLEGFQADSTIEDEQYGVKTGERVQVWSDWGGGEATVHVTRWDANSTQQFRQGSRFNSDYRLVAWSALNPVNAADERFVNRMKSGARYVTGEIPRPDLSGTIVDYGFTGQEVLNNPNAILPWSVAGSIVSVCAVGTGIPTFTVECSGTATSGQDGMKTWQVDIKLTDTEGEAGGSTITYQVTVRTNSRGLIASATINFSSARESGTEQVGTYTSNAAIGNTTVPTPSITKRNSIRSDIFTGTAASDSVKRSGETFRNIAARKMKQAGREVTANNLQWAMDNFTGNDWAKIARTNNSWTTVVAPYYGKATLYAESSDSLTRSGAYARITVKDGKIVVKAKAASGSPYLRQSKTTANATVAPLLPLL